MAPAVRANIGAWPSSKRMTSIKEIYVAAQNLHQNELQTRHTFVWFNPDTSTESLLFASDAKDQKSRHALERIIEKHCVDHLLTAEVSCDNTEQILRDILEVWENTGEGVDDVDRRMLAILVSRDIDNPSGHTCECIYELAVDLSLGRSSSFVRDIVRIVRVQETDSRQAIIALTNTLAAREGCKTCWRMVLLRWLNQSEKQEARWGTAIIDHLIQTMDPATWLSFMQSLETIFADIIADNTNKHELPSLLQPQILTWVSQVSKFGPTLTKLEEVSDSSFAVIEYLSELLDAPYEAIEACNEIWDARCGFLDIPGLPTHERAGLSRIVSRDVVYYDGASKQYKIMTQPDSLTPKKKKPLQTIAKRRYDIPLAVAEVMVAGWIQDDDVALETKTIIERLAQLLDLKVYKQNIPKSELSKATEFWNGIEAEIMQEAERLEGLKRTLKAKDPLQTALLIEEYNIPDSNMLEDEIQELPPGIIDLVELIDDDEIEMSFTLASYTELQRSAMGVPSTANNLLLRLTIDRYGSKPPAFCVHYDSDKGIETDQHFPWICVATSNAPHGNVCFSKQTVFVWQMNRHIHRYLRAGNVSLRGLYGLVQTMIGEMGQRCISCGCRHKGRSTQLRRSTPCWTVACQLLWYALPLDVRIPEIRTDIFAVDMLLSSIYSAAMANKAELLPNCPIHPISTVKTILDSLPKLSVIRDAVHISTVLSRYHADAEKLISWACTHYRGYIATASGLCRIKNLPTGTHHFVLANASPALESAYMAKFPSPSTQTTVLFHGTSLDRLPAILAKGLIVCSGTTLQRTGAVYGRGIYMAEDPATSFSYAPVYSTWKNSALANMRVILGCEVVGQGNSVTTGVHVITDEASVMVRYIFLFRQNAHAPVANHVVTAMKSAMAAIRTGVV
ncbi:uncharacterized protein J4E88_003013 [Alternaria novae-zelandiae]|uniref:uncharacterized protein n=1 Tax=Alternaria novae-zelandiae TaxID=430562 RepID=UPI0020C47A98|nr:uncharacterized protein J4E88_003013 [Alternaria novae-zelandiae]KAI4689658.1 hypothetical protein J4E88_003013 [Alternaria novae-zelandiae]